MLKEEGNREYVLFYTMLIYLRKSIVRVGVPSFVHLSFCKSKMYINMGMDHWWNDTDRGN